MPISNVQGAAGQTPSYFPESNPSSTTVAGPPRSTAGSALAAPTRRPLALTPAVADSFCTGGGYQRAYDQLAADIPGFAEAHKQYQTAEHKLFERKQFYALGHSSPSGMPAFRTYPKGQPPLGAVLTFLGSGQVNLGDNTPFLSKDQLREGDLLVTAVRTGHPVNQFRQTTLTKQSFPHGGVNPNQNQGCYRDAHATIFVRPDDHSAMTPAETGWSETGFYEVVEARMDNGRIDRMNRGALNDVEHDFCKVYRLVGPDASERKNAIARVAELFADGNIIYSMGELSSSFKTNGPSCTELPPQAQELIKKMARECTEGHEWARNSENTASRYRNGATCSTLVAKVFAVAEMRRLLTAKVEKDAAAAVDTQAKEAIYAAVDKIDMDPLINELKGVFALNSPLVSPQLIEHFFLTAVDEANQPQMKCVGLFKAEPTPLFAETPPPASTHALQFAPPLPADHPHSKEYAAKAKADAIAAAAAPAGQSSAV